MQLPDKGFLNITQVGAMYAVVDSEGPLCKTESVDKLLELILAESTLQSEGGARELVFPGTNTKRIAMQIAARDRAETLRERMLSRMQDGPVEGNPAKGVRTEGLD